MDKIEAKYLQKSQTYEAYMQLMTDLTSQSKTTGDDQSEIFIEFTKLNLSRINRLNKTAQLNLELTGMVEKWTMPMTILVITEAWCGDAAQQLPWFRKIANLNKLIEIKTILRDENPELMNRYLTNSISKSIPVVLFLNEDKEVMYKWGPRTASLNTLIQSWSSENLPKNEKNIRIHTWYAKNKGVDLQLELTLIFKEMSKKREI
jgi:Thioredoxin